MTVFELPRYQIGLGQMVRVGVPIAGWLSLLHTVSYVEHAGGWLVVRDGYWISLS